MKQTTFSLLGVIAAVTLISVVASQDAYAHGHANFPLTLPNGDARTITVVLGHTNEPTYANEPGTWNGLHDVDISISDADTKIPISGASLQVDKYYFEDQKSFDKANSVNKADAKELGVTVSYVYGQPGKYLVRQMVAEGIYGYHVYGTVKYFDGQIINVDFTGFCKEAGDKFNSGSYSGDFGCVGDINDLKFPKAGHHSNQFDNDNKSNDKDNKSKDH